MCGIVAAVLTNPGNVVDKLLKPLQRLEYRGYDSCGYYSSDLKEYTLYRTEGDVNKLFEPCGDNFIQGIAHTRWATHGAVTVENSHPQVSNERIYVVHNGVIDNFLEIKTSLVKKGYIFKSETDTEVIAHLIDNYVEGMRDMAGIDYPMSTAVCLAMEDLKGKFSFIAVDLLSNTMVAVSHGRPLIVYRDNNETFIASDIAAFQGMAEGEIYYMKQGEVTELNNNEGHKIRRVRLINGVRVQEKIVSEFTKYTPEQIDVSTSMRTFMEAEIRTQPTAIRNTIDNCTTEQIRETLSNLLIPEFIEKVAIIGCGTSYHAAQMGAKWLKMLADVDAQAFIASEFSNQSAIDNKTSLFIFISQSGETADTLAALDLVSQYAPHKTMAICNVEQSELVRRCKYRVLTSAGIERSVASTKAFTAQLIALLKTSIAVGNITKQGMGSISFIMSDLEKAMQEIDLLVYSMLDQTAIDVKVMIDKWNPKSVPKQVIFLGRDVLYPIALEGALKLAEIAYIPSLTYFTGELKHGPLALIDDKTPVFCVFSNSEQNLEKMFSSLNQVQARGGRIYLISDVRGIDLAKKAGIKPIGKLYLPSLTRYEHILTPILAMIPLQMMAHEIALKLGRNVDRPRNLAKSVTVE